MAATLLTCPNCNATLKLNNSVPAGKAIKCPRCANIFRPGPAPETAAKKASAVKAKAAPAEEAVRARRSDPDEVTDVVAARRKPEGRR